MDEKDLTELLISGRGPAVLYHDKVVLEVQDGERTKRKIEYEGKTLVVEEFERTVRTRHLIIREFNPEKNYGDALDEFLQPGGEE